MRCMTPCEFFRDVLNVAKQCGYDVDGKQHPEDIVANLVPLMEAYVHGYTQGSRKC